MSKLMYKEQPINDIVLQSLRNGIDDMKQATQKTYSMDVPSGFSRIREMANCKSSIIKITKDLQELEQWIIDSNKKIDNALKSMSNEAELLPQSQLLTRKEVVR